MKSPHYQLDLLCHDAIGHNARLHGRHTAVVCGEQRLSWAELHLRTNQVANAILGLGLRKGDKVCTLMPNSIAAFELFWGVVKAGCVIVPLNTLLDGAALARMIDASDGRLIFCDDSTVATVDAVRGELRNIDDAGYFTTGRAREGWLDAAALVSAAGSAAPEVSIGLHDTMTIMYSSGTTGTPKGIEHSHLGRLNYPWGFSAGVQIDRYSVAICSTPIFASGTWITMFPTMYRGGTVVLLPKFSPELFLDAVQRERGTHTFMVPTQYISILQHGVERHDTSSLRVIISAGQTLLQSTFDALRQTFPQAGIYEIYGMTEGFSTLAIPQDAERGKRGSVGKPSFLEDIRIIATGGSLAELPTGEVGEIVAYGPGMMKGYYGRPELTDQTTWIGEGGRTYLRSGDIGYLDTDGFLYVCGRLKDMIKSGGINIYAVDLEQILIQHPDVSEVAVIGVPHEKWQETPVAVVVPRAGAAVASEELRAWANERLAKYQRLSAVILRPDFPRATYGKVQKQALREEYRGLYP
ncbi:MAG: class I adenylate-forming enzyme family protein [Panacagrimonas sp.]